MLGEIGLSHVPLDVCKQPQVGDIKPCMRRTLGRPQLPQDADRLHVCIVVTRFVTIMMPSLLKVMSPVTIHACCSQQGDYEERAGTSKEQISLCTAECSAALGPRP